jgi:putative transposase
LTRCKLLGINRTRIYYKAKVDSFEEQALESKIYTIWDEYNFKGSRMICAELNEYHNMVINRKRVQRIMRKLNIQGILPKRNLSKPGDLQYKHPYYLGGMKIYRSNQVWATDITYVKLPTGMMYVICLLDLYSRYVVGYVISNTLDTSGCLECLEHATTKHGHPKMLNSDQGSQFTSLAWVNKLSQLDIIISMDGKGRWADNVYVERFWRTLKRECIYANGVESVTQLHTEVARYIRYYNQQRLHSSLGYKTPCAVYQKNLEDITECVFYCEYPAQNNRVRIKKKRVLPTIIIREAA